MTLNKLQKGEISPTQQSITNQPNPIAGFLMLNRLHFHKFTEKEIEVLKIGIKFSRGGINEWIQNYHYNLQVILQKLNNKEAYTKIFKYSARYLVGIYILFLFDNMQLSTFIKKINNLLRGYSEHFDFKIFNEVHKEYMQNSKFNNYLPTKFNAHIFESLEKLRKLRIKDNFNENFNATKHLLNTNFFNDFKKYFNL